VLYNINKLGYNVSMMSDKEIRQAAASRLERGKRRNKFTVARDLYSKHTPGKEGLLAIVYQCRPGIETERVKAVVELVFGMAPTDNIMAVWRNRLRAKGVALPDGRSNK